MIDLGSGGQTQEAVEGAELEEQVKNYFFKLLEWKNCIYLLSHFSTCLQQQATVSYMVISLLSSLLTADWRGNVAYFMNVQIGNG